VLDQQWTLRDQGLLQVDDDTFFSDREHATAFCRRMQRPPITMAGCRRPCRSRTLRRCCRKWKRFVGRNTPRF
jgi:hypothetical protein